MESNIPVIAIDGPSGTGKGTLCQRLADRLGWHLLDSGAIYRVLALDAVRRRLDFNDLGALEAAARDLKLSFQPGPEGIRVLLAGEDVTDAIRTEEAGNAASRVAAVPAVRSALLARQRAFRRAPGLIADGRDMGTVVFPTARLKVFLTASAEERAQRRYNQLKQKGQSVSLPALFQDITERDERDRARPVSPLVPAPDARVLDTTKLDIESVFAQVMEWIEELGLAGGI